MEWLQGIKDEVSLYHNLKKIKKKVLLKMLCNIL